jgi:hypothetical protein
MKNLIYIPIIHSGADMGSMAAELTRKSIDEFGKDFWEKHVESVNRYWQNIQTFCSQLEFGARTLKIYQDGMVIDGEIAGKIIEENAKNGSLNYEIILNLVRRGAVVVQTEDLSLVKKEVEMLKQIPTSGALIMKLIRIFIYKIERSRLLRQRDRFIARRIAETLGENETGILFLGAFHNILDKLPPDIHVKPLKERDKIREYQKLLPFHKNRKERVEVLSEYLSEL